MHGRSGLVKGGIAVLAAAAAVLVAAPAANADDGAAQGKVIKGASTTGFSVDFGERQQPVATLFGLKLSDGSMLKMYCVEIDTDLSYTQTMVERPWDKYPNPKSPFTKNNTKLNWVLHEGYPAHDVKTLQSTVAKGGVTFHDGLSEEEAITATQAAVWHFSDDKNLLRDKPLPYEDADTTADVLAVYDYLTGSANTGIGQQPKPTLNITPAKADGTAGTRIGPFTVTSTGSITDLAAQLPEGAKLTDANGEELKTGDVKDGSKLYVDIPKDAKAGNGEFSLKATGHLDTGRLFVGQDYDKHPAQSLIVAQSEKAQVSANAAVSWTVVAPTTPAPSTPAGNNSGQAPLANTGVDASLPIGIGAALVLGGGAMLLLVRRRRSA
ncbi:thioester domain-containing protein [Amycolatopsis sp. PS_44_ISF1]|uniref:thioester domain-containing protein n=1 Tax=Amycolatopsis sp. PS_44_ISF1 TaxID=2974917 RepID=UPI0028DFAA84|nr:thioester domain-containing protein [Amycolatopsis sp. PS_44_ISF1]MDT8911424.1 thioester domain-containing protein [Amycolatopsis sp. PS_44_ISF1]